MFLRRSDDPAVLDCFDGNDFGSRELSRGVPFASVNAPGLMRFTATLGDGSDFSGRAGGADRLYFTRAGKRKDVKLTLAGSRRAEIQVV